MAATDVPRYHVLGPLTATIDGDQLPLGGKRQRLVLAQLIARSGHVVSQEALMEGVWAGNTPASGARTLHTYVSNLRRILNGSIERDGDGYVLRTEPETIDANRFEDSLKRGRELLIDSPPEAADVLHEGLGLWAGPPYGDLGLEPALRLTVEQLGAKRLEALELRFEADLLLGRHTEIAPELEALLHEEPYREPMASMLMVALYRSGRPADALKVYQRVRANLVEDLGLDPGPELKLLEQRILQQDPTLALEIESNPTERRGARGS